MGNAGNCVLRDCGIDLEKAPNRNTEKIQKYLKDHLKDKFFEKLIRKNSKGDPEIINLNEFKSSLNDFNCDIEEKPIINDNKKVKSSRSNDYYLTEIGTIIKPNFLEKEKQKDKKIQNISYSKESTKKINNLIPTINISKPDLPKFENVNYKEDLSISGINNNYYEDELLDSLSMIEAKKNKNVNTNADSIFHNRLFENITPSATNTNNVRSDDEDNIGEYEKIFRDDEFNDSSDNDDYIKKKFMQI